MAVYTYKFTDNSKPGPNGAITKWEWDFGDGGTSLEESPTHDYTTTGPKTVKLTITSPDGTATVTKTINVTPTAILNASFSYSANNLAVTFQDTSTPGESGPITNWAWDFGDGNTSTAQNPPVHNYATAGTKTVTLEVTGSGSDGTDIYTVQITVSASSSSPPPPTGGIKGVGSLHYNHLSTDSSAHLDTYTTIVGGAKGSSDIGVLNARTNQRTCYYVNWMVCQADYDVGVPYTQAQANGWLLKNSSGSLMKSGGYNAYLADFGLAAYQNAWVTNILAYLAAHPGIDGVFIDTCLYNPLSAFGGYPPKYPNQTAWQNACLSCANAVRNGLHSKGKYVLSNAGGYWRGNPGSDSGQTTVDWWKLIGPYSDGLCCEYWQQKSNDHAIRASGTSAWYYHWEGWQRLISVAESIGRDFHGLSYGTDTDTNKMMYCRSSFLVEWNGTQSSTFMYDVGAVDPYNLAWTRNIGTPSGAKTAVGVGYMRHFTSGVVCINPHPTSSQAFSLGGTYTDNNGTSRSSITLAPMTAMIFHT